MMDFNERMIPNVSAQFLYFEAVARYEFARKFVKNNYKILDAACGTGYGSNILSQKKGVYVDAYDISSEAIAYCKQNYAAPNINFHTGDVTKLKMKKKYDIITAMEIIEHLDDGVQFAKKIRSILKNGGKFIVSTPNAKIVENSNLPKSPYHEHEFELKEFKQVLRKAGFRKCEIYGQNKNEKAKHAFKKFLDSQDVRQGFVDSDVLGIRKLLAPEFKEFFWKHVAKLFGGKQQYQLNSSDFPIKILSSKDLSNSEYFVAVCQ